MSVPISTNSLEDFNKNHEAIFEQRKFYFKRSSS